MSKKFEVSAAPHFRSDDSLTKRAVTDGIALFPFILMRTVQEPLKALCVFGLVLAGGFAAVCCSAFVLQKKKPLMDSGAAAYLMLLALMTPSQIPWPGIFAAGFAALFIGRECYGAKGYAFSHPSLLGCIFLVLCFPEIMKESPAWLFSFHSPAENLPAAVAGGATLLAGSWLLLRKKTDWKIPAVYLFLTIGVSAFMNILSTLSFAGVFFAAFFFITDASAAPMTSQGRLVFAALSALLTLVLDLLSVPWAPAFAVLALSLFTPWMEQWTLPAGIRQAA